MSRLPYEQFWEELAPAYPVSQGSLRLPIVAELQEVTEVSLPEVVPQLAELLQQMLDQADGVAGAKARAEKAGETALAPWITENYTGIVRFDCVLDTAGALHVLELNADHPDGFALHDHTYGVLVGAPSTLHRKQLQALVANASAVHITHPAGADFLDGYHAERLALEAAGHTVTVGTAEDAPKSAWQRRCVEVSKLSAVEIQALSEGETPVLNSWALRTLGYKQQLAHVSHPLLPETVALGGAAARQRVTTDPARWVLKPGQGCEGEGIYFGAEYTPAGWAERLATLPDGYVAQQYVELAKRTVPVYTDEAIVEQELYFDLCPHFVVQDGKVTAAGHVLMRFSASPIVNVSQGGAIGYHRLPEARGFSLL